MIKTIRDYITKRRIEGYVNSMVLKSERHTQELKKEKGENFSCKITSMVWGNKNRPRKIVDNDGYRITKIKYDLSGNIKSKIMIILENDKIIGTKETRLANLG